MATRASGAVPSYVVLGLALGPVLHVVEVVLAVPQRADGVGVRPWIGLFNLVRWDLTRRDASGITANAVVLRLGRLGQLFW